MCRTIKLGDLIFPANSLQHLNLLAKLSQLWKVLTAANVYACLHLSGEPRHSISESFSGDECVKFTAFGQRSASIGIDFFINHYRKTVSLSDHFLLAGVDRQRRLQFRRLAAVSQPQS